MTRAGIGAQGDTSSFTLHFTGQDIELEHFGSIAMQHTVKTNQIEWCDKRTSIRNVLSLRLTAGGGKDCLGPRYGVLVMRFQGKSVICSGVLYSDSLLDLCFRVQAWVRVSFQSQSLSSRHKSRACGG